MLGNFVLACDLLGRASLVLGQIEEAGRLANCAIEAIAARPVGVPRVLWLLGDIASHPDRFNPELGETYYRKAMASAEAQGQRPVMAHCHLGLGKLFSRIGKRQAADEHLAIAATMYRDMDMRFWLEQTEAERRGTA